MKIQDKHVKLRYNQRTYYGDNDDCSIWHDGSWLRISCTVSGVDPTQDFHLTTKQYVDAAVSGTNEFLELTDTPVSYTGYGDSFVKVNVGETGLEFTSLSGINALLDHGLLLGLDDDDHPAYVPRDGSRGFTATVSGVYPTQDYHLTTKQYVDEHSYDTKSGRTALATDDSSKSVLYGSAFVNTDYSISVMMRNTVDGNPSIYPMIVTGTTTSGFDVLFSGDIDSNNYYLDWICVADD